MLTIEITCPPGQGNFRYPKKLKTKFCDYDGFVEEIRKMIDSGELRRMVEGMTEYHGGQEKMFQEWNEGCQNFFGTKESK